MESEGSIIFEFHLEIIIQSGCQRNACIGSPKATCTEIHSSTSVEAPKIGTSAFHMEVTTPWVLSAILNLSNVILEQESQRKTTLG